MIAVWCEVDPTTGAVSEVSLEALAFARHLSDQGPAPVEVTAIVVGGVPDQDQVATTLGDHGATSVTQSVGEALTAFGGAAFASAIAAARGGASVILAGGTPRGMEVMAHLAARLDVPMAANVVSVEQPDPLIVRRQVAGGAAFEDMSLVGSPAVVTVAGHAWEPENGLGGPAEWTATEPDISADDRVAQIKRQSDPEPDESGSLTSARVVVGAGRGAGGPEGFGPVSELAELLGGAVGVSRVVTSLGWRPHHEQVGQTGSRIAPDLYIPCGISGAIQHWAGCSSSQHILAINTDAEAPMMTRADYAVVGDMHEVVPEIVAEIKRRRS